MASFLQLGTHWLNLERVSEIELIPPGGDLTSSEVSKARVTFNGGETREFVKKEHIQAFQFFLETHKAS